MKVKKELKELIRTSAKELHMTKDELLEEALNLYLEEQEKKKFIEELWSSSIANLDIPSNVFIALLQYDIKEMKDFINVDLIKIPGIGPKTVELLEERLTTFFKSALSRS